MKTEQEIRIGICENTAMITMIFDELMEHGEIKDWDELIEEPEYNGQIGICNKISLLAMEFEEKFDKQTDCYYESIDEFARKRLIEEYGKPVKFNIKYKEKWTASGVFELNVKEREELKNGTLPKRIIDILNNTKCPVDDFWTFEEIK